MKKVYVGIDVHKDQYVFDCVVIAPSKIPKKSGDLVKTDRIYACKGGWGAWPGLTILM